MYKKKSLGQHFLHAKTYLRAVADAAEIQVRELVVEIGPGDGALTEELLARGAQVIAIEKDRRLIPLLQEKFAEALQQKRLRVVEGDALAFDPQEHRLKAGSYTVVGNIPYYITGSLIRKFLTVERQPASLVFLMQKEVAQRIARAKKESLLSLSVKAFGTPAYIQSVPRGAFAPPPEVDSAIVRVSSISRKNFADARHEELFFKLLHAGFGQKRKLLWRNLQPILGEGARGYMERAGIETNARAEDVGAKQWLALAAQAAQAVY